MIGNRVGKIDTDPFHWRIFLLAATTLLLAAGPLHAQDMYGARPASLDGDRPSGGYALTAEPGTSIADAVEIFNFTNEPATFDVYPVDVVLAADGKRTPASRDTERTGPATWIVVHRARVDVPPQKSVVTSFEVAVPEGTAVDHYTAALMVEPQRGEGTGAIVNRTRIGLWVEIDVAAHTSPAPAPGTPSRWPWLPIVVIMLATAAVLYRVARVRLRPWNAARQEQQGRRNSRTDPPRSAHAQRRAPRH
jgi:hypothetical protein